MLDSTKCGLLNLLISINLEDGLILGTGTMGVGLPYALGVQLAHPNSLVGCITGEASIQMCIQELSTAKQYNLQ